MPPRPLFFYTSCSVLKNSGRISNKIQVNSHGVYIPVDKQICNYVNKIDSYECKETVQQMIFMEWIIEQDPQLHPLSFYMHHTPDSFTANGPVCIPYTQVNLLCHPKSSPTCPVDNYTWLLLYHVVSWPVCIQLFYSFTSTFSPSQLPYFTTHDKLLQMDRATHNSPNHTSTSPACHRTPQEPHCPQHSRICRLHLPVYTKFHLLNPTQTRTADLAFCFRRECAWSCSPIYFKKYSAYYSCHSQGSFSL